MNYSQWQADNPLAIWMKEHNARKVHTAILLGVSRQTVLNWVSGVVPSDEHLDKIENLTEIYDLKKQWMRWRSGVPKEVG